jgi:hypothetical protein
MLHVLLHVGHFRVVALQDLMQAESDVLVEVHPSLVTINLFVLCLTEQAILRLLVVADGVLQTGQELLDLQDLCKA